MKQMTFAAAAMAGFIVSAPAMADYVRLGSVDVGYHMDRDTSWTRFGGGMEGLRLVADGNDVWCRSIVAHFADGELQNVYSGMLREDRPVEVDLRGGVRHVRDVQFTCRSDRGGARIFLSAEVGRFRDEWMRSPDWSGYWQGVFGGGDRRGRDADYWVTLGHERFEGRNDRENHFAGWGGQSVDRIGLRALNDDATCWPMRVEFANGSSTSIGVGHLEQGRPKSFDLPGQERNVRNIVLNCHADHGHAVTIDILARK